MPKPCSRANAHVEGGKPFPADAHNTALVMSMTSAVFLLIMASVHPARACERSASQALESACRPGPTKTNRHAHTAPPPRRQKQMWACKQSRHTF